MAQKKKKSGAGQQANPTNQMQVKPAANGVTPIAKPRVSRRQQRAVAQGRSARLKQFRIVGLVAFVIVAIAAFAFWRNAGVVPVEEVTAPIEPNLDGPADAPVRVVEFGDFGCPSCRAWHNAGIKQQLQAEFGDQVAFEFRHFPVITAQSPKAAEAGQCAAEQDAFWAYHDYIYESTPQGALAVTDLKRYAAAIGLEQEAFDACLDSGKYRDFIVREQQTAVALGARGTPSFFINGKPVFFTYDNLAAEIRSALGG